MKPQGDNFEIVYDAQGWRSPEPPPPALALVLAGLLSAEKVTDQDTPDQPQQIGGEQ